MGKFKKIQTDIEGLYIVEPTVFGDTEDSSWKHGTKMIS